MKASKFPDAQKAFMLKQGDDGVPGGDLPEGRDQSGDIFQLEKEVCGVVTRRDASTEANRGREQSAQEDCGGPDIEPRDASGRYSAKALRPVRKRKLVDCGSDRHPANGVRNSNNAP